MSTPVNHHYVSQCHQKGFFNDSTGLIYIYDKELDNYYSKKSSKHLFSEDHLNTKEQDGHIDQVSLEKELKILIEDEFAEHIKKIENFLLAKGSNEVPFESLYWLTSLGIIGELRNPKYKKELDNHVLKLESNILRHYYNFSKKTILKFLRTKQVPFYSNTLGYLDTAFKTLEKLAPLDFLIISIESNDHFILPDTSCFQLRGQLSNYANAFIKEIIQIGVPLTDKLYILATPNVLKSDMHVIRYERSNNSELVYEINKDLYLFSKKAVACSDNLYLEKLIERIKNDI